MAIGYYIFQPALIEEKRRNESKLLKDPAIIQQPVESSKNSSYEAPPDPKPS
jgi:hypothetical protein